LGHDGRGGRPGVMEAAEAAAHYEEDIVSWAVRRAPGVLGRYLITDVVELWEKVPLARRVPFLGATVSMVHYLGLLAPLLVAHLRVPADECAVTDPIFSLCWWNGGLKCTTSVMCLFVGIDLMAATAFYMFERMDTARRRLTVMVLSLIYHTMPLAGVIINSQIDRSPHAAIFDALIYTVSQFCFNRSTFVRMVANFFPCFGWHFLKRTIPALFAARGYDVGHLLCAVAVYTISIVASCTLQPLIDAQVKVSRMGVGGAASRSSKSAEARE